VVRSACSCERMIRSRLLSIIAEGALAGSPGTLGGALGVAKDGIDGRKRSGAPLVHRSARAFEAKTLSTGKSLLTGLTN